MVPKSIESEQRLSHAFEVDETSPDLEAVVHVFDFNMTGEEVALYLEAGEIPTRFESHAQHSLFWYAMFVNCVEYRYGMAMSSEQTAKVQMLAEMVTLFTSRGILVELFNKKVVVDMVLMEFSREMDLRLGGFYQGLIEDKEEGKALGIAEGIAEGKAEGKQLTKEVFKWLKNKRSDTEIKQEFLLSDEELASFKADFLELFGE